ncbi:MAG: putative carbohydrate kinase [Eubacterium sp.]|nr:putative carbohydrate kinase [Eubacterium sp.]
MKEFDLLSIGELNVDLILSGLQNMPVVGKEIIADDCSIVLGSSTAICSCGAAKLGLKTGFIGKLGNDSFSEIILKSLAGYGINLEHIIVDEGIKTGITVSLSTKKDRALVTYLGSIDTLSIDDFDLELINKAKHIHVGSYFLQSKLRKGLPKLFSYARERGITTSLDSGWDETENWDYGIFEVLKQTDIFFPNEVEALNITKANSVEEAIDILSKYCGTAVVKLGPKGAVAKRGDSIVSRRPYDVVPVDTTGAGDSFNAGFIFGFINRFDLSDCINYGNACGSISVTNKGGASACASIDQVVAMINRG